MDIRSEQKGFAADFAPVFEFANVFCPSLHRLPKDSMLRPKARNISTAH